VGENLGRGSLVVLESTVFPGTTEEIIAPILEKYSGLTCGRDFKIGYSPERVSPGDDAHTLDKVTKVVAGMDAASTAVLKELYGAVAPEVFVARDIKTAEAAKVIENIQRDLNIALMNELAMIFARIGVDTRDVLATAATKWNFNPYTPGLVGGHCIPVDPYYLVHKARQLNYASRVILAGRAINDQMPAYVAEMTEGALEEAGKPVKGARVLLMGLTYKENVADTRETPAKALIKELRRRGMRVLGYEPLLTNVNGEFGVEALAGLDGVRADAFILTVGHQVFRELSLEGLKEMSTGRPVLIDIRGLFDRRQALEMGFCYRTL
jgi:UDP-N-acetyl-D-galactosamine dehydrogenase